MAPRITHGVAVLIVVNVAIAGFCVYLWSLVSEVEGKVLGGAPIREAGAIPVAAALAHPSASSGASAVPAGSNWRQVGGLEYKLEGHTLQMLTFKLTPGQSVVTETGKMVSISKNIHIDLESNGAKNWLDAESFYKARYTNQGSGAGQVALGVTLPGQLLVIDFREVGSNTVFAVKGAFIAGSTDIELSGKWSSTLFGGFLSYGLHYEKMKGDGLGFVVLETGGTLMRKELQPMETFRTMKGNGVAWTENVTVDTEPIARFGSKLSGGVGWHLAVYTGPGTLWVQSVSVGMMAVKMCPARSGSSRRRGLGHGHGHGHGHGLGHGHDGGHFGGHHGQDGGHFGGH